VASWGGPAAHSGVPSSPLRKTEGVARYGDEPFVWAEIFLHSDPKKSRGASPILPIRRKSELQPELQRDHSRTAIAAQAHSQQSGGGRRRVGERPKSRLCGRLSRNARVHIAGESEVWVIENVEELGVQAKSYLLANGEPFGHVKVAPEEVRTAKGIAAKRPELAVLETIAAVAVASAGIDRRYKSIGIEPLNRARLGDAGDVAMSWGRLNQPAPSVFAVRFRPVSRFVIFTAALGTTAPVPSLTCPTIALVVSPCARANAESRETATITNRPKRSEVCTAH